MVDLMSLDPSSQNVGPWRKSRGRKPNRHSQLIRLGYRHRAKQSPLSRYLAKGASDRYCVRVRPENPAGVNGRALVAALKSWLEPLFRHDVMEERALVAISL